MPREDKQRTTCTVVTCKFLDTFKCLLNIDIHVIEWEITDVSLGWRKEILYGDGQACEIGQTNPTTECNVTSMALSTTVDVREWFIYLSTLFKMNVSLTLACYAKLKM